jgi:hypothetical protein
MSLSLRDLLLLTWRWGPDLHDQLAELPVAALPTCQKELENMAMAVHTLAYGHKFLAQRDGELSTACAVRANALLKAFFVDVNTR